MGVSVTAVVADITTEEGRRAVLAAAPQPDILINNAGGPPPGDFRGVERDAWISAVDANMLTPIFLIRETIDGMIAPLRPNSQHHDIRSKVACDLSAARRLDRRSRRPHRLCRRAHASGCRPTRMSARCPWRRNSTLVHTPGQT
jgi:NAD(P)-dependent dehydrogenase (short-subunit alcohol dehydrogenase family)